MMKSVSRLLATAQGTLKFMSPKFKLLAILALAGSAFGQRYTVSTINPATPDGKVLQQGMSEEDPAKKLALLEQYITDFGGKDKMSTGWALTQMEGLYQKAGNYDKVVETSNKLLSMDGSDLDAAYAALKASEAKKDADGIIKWSGVTSDIAQKTIAKPKTGNEEEWKTAVDYAKQVDTYTEYSLYSTALQSTDAGRVMQLVETLNQHNPKSQYLAQTLGKYAQSAQQAKQMPRAAAFGEQVYANGQLNEDLLLAMSDYYMAQKTQMAKAAVYGSKAAEFVASKPKPDGISDTDWDKKKISVIGLGNWMAGVSYASDNKFEQADKALRVALPNVQDNLTLKATTLFYLGLADYKLGQATKSKTMINDAYKFSQQSAAMKSPVQDQAAKNVLVIKKEFKLN
jgi:tetratricopeptide (TPR) repeat protein